MTAPMQGMYELVPSGSTRSVQIRHVQVDKYGNLIVTHSGSSANGVIMVAPGTPVVSATTLPQFTGTLNFVASGSISTAPTVLLSAFTHIDVATGDLHLQYFNTGSVPAQGAVPTIFFGLNVNVNSTQGNTFITRDAMAGGHYFSNGLSWALSSTTGSNTDPGLAMKLATSTQHRFST